MQFRRRLASALFLFPGCGPTPADPAPAEEIVSGIYRSAYDLRESNCANPAPDDAREVAVYVAEDALALDYFDEYTNGSVTWSRAELERDVDAPARYSTRWTHNRHPCGATEEFEMVAELDHEALVISAWTRSAWVGTENCADAPDYIPRESCSAVYDLEYTLIEACIDPCVLEDDEESRLYCSC